jgi:hypothetical protein
MVLFLVLHIYAGGREERVARVYAVKCYKSSITICSLALSSDVKILSVCWNLKTLNTCTHVIAHLEPRHRHIFLLREPRTF